MSWGKQFISAVIATGSTTALLQFGHIAPLFRASEKPVYDFVTDFVKKHGSLPAAETIEAHTGDTLIPHVEPPSYYIELMEGRHKEFLVRKAFEDAKVHLDPAHKDEDAALEVLGKAFMEGKFQKYSKDLVDFREMYELLIADYASKQLGAAGGGVNLGWPYLDTSTGGLGKSDLLSMVGRPSMGKAIAHGTTVVLRDGSTKPIEAICVGDELASVDGAPSRVYGVYAQGVRSIWRVTFGDGRSLDVDKDHLWRVGCKYWDGERVMTTGEIMRWRGKAKRYADTLWIPVANGEFGGYAKPIIDAYTLGVLLGDGGLTKSATLTSMDPEIVDRVRQAMPAGHDLVETSSTSSGAAKVYQLSRVNGDRTHGGNVVLEALRTYGLFGKKSEAKHIPSQALCWPRNDRVALLQGLMDTDGTVTKDGSSVFGSSSERLVDDVISLVRSIGGKAKKTSTKPTTHLDHHRATVILPEPGLEFSLSRKRERCSAYTVHDPKHLRIVSIEPVGEREATCIAVTHPSRLFLAGDYVVTHNTWQLLYAAWSGWQAECVKTQPESDQSRLFVSMEMSALQIGQRVAAIQTHLPAQQIKLGMLPTKPVNALKRFKEGLLAVQDYKFPFYIVDGNLTATVEDIAMLARQLKPAAIFIDGGYLVTNPTQKDMFAAVRANANLMKQELAKLAPTVVSWQFSRQGAKKNLKKGEDAGLEDIGYSDGIGQVSSIVLGLFEEDSVETLKSRRVRVLKGRHGEIGQFYTNWNFMQMDFTEIVEPAVEDLNYV